MRDCLFLIVSFIQTLVITTTRLSSSLSADRQSVRVLSSTLSAGKEARGGAASAWGPPLPPPPPLVTPLPSERVAPPPPQPRAAEGGGPGDAPPRVRRSYGASPCSGPASRGTADLGGELLRPERQPGRGAGGGPHVRFSR